jgi:hypothetical protein
MVADAAGEVSHYAGFEVGDGGAELGVEVGGTLAAAGLSASDMQAVMVAAAATSNPNDTYGFGAVGLTSAAVVDSSTHDGADGEHLNVDVNVDVEEEGNEDGYLQMDEEEGADLGGVGTIVRRCGECNVDTADGRIDHENGTFYCSGCWTSFEAF